MTRRDRLLADEATTLSLGAELAAGLQAGTTIHLHGDLGAGKTTLVRGLLRGAGFGGRVKSPTFSLVELYEVSKLSLYHFDFYRFDDPRAWLEAGFGDCFDGTHVCCIEWPEKAGGMLPAPDLEIYLEWTPGAGRKVSLQARSPRGERCLEGLLAD